MSIYTKSQQEIAENISSKAVIKDWKDWRWQFRHTIKTVEDFEDVLNISFSPEEKKEMKITLRKFPMAITPYYASLIDIENYKDDPVFKQSCCSTEELHVESYEMGDPLAEDSDSPVENLTHRYPDRVLFHVSNMCAMYCRHCTRKRKVGDQDHIPAKDSLIKGLEYIREHEEVRDVLLSGGDPFMLSDSAIEWLLDEISSIEHVEVIRIGTRMPVVLPYRITEDLIDILSKYDNLWINTHFNHPRELTDSSRQALKKLVKAGIPMGNQTVLLAGVNDCPYIMKSLMHKLVKNRVRPYYIYQCDLSEGLSHFRTPVSKGIEIIESLRGHTSGFAVPTYVIDAPGGGGKIPVTPNYVVSYATNKVILRNYEGVICTYKEPDSYEPVFCDRKCETCTLELKTEGREYLPPVGVEKLMADYDDETSLIPADNERIIRRNSNG
ncbi:lysine 2,3-aminomutase YodO family protein [Denitrovibrio acetiphilus DSM 12809]|uniref:L-lysine 2,3-aminomutase n=1 Tax=Denitrovibrio acetiphilus (strain DSM 12809 / NBRC 114555 / N2460) TaxID=522772 RepID=D4H601_DENA2|nr:lysine 2,3-aminomutase [Denitrovibrio acetiphilus]ADD67647.1 lysine 2,3-aminomutase YodO family protein [Denitrovibrio acetiphilus DSM 12809]